jgi:hypothetical protein
MGGISALIVMFLLPFELSQYPYTHTHTQTLMQGCFNITLPTTFRSCLWSPSFNFLTVNLFRGNKLNIFQSGDAVSRLDD